MSQPQLSLSLKELLVTITLGALLLVACRGLGFEPWVGTATAMYLTAATVLLLLGRGQ